MEVYDCDFEAKQLMLTDPEVKKALEEKIGADVYTKDGEVNKRMLAERLFSSEEVRKTVNGIVHSAVKKDILSRKEKSTGTFFIESAILATSRLWEICDRVWLVESPLEERIRRIKKRDNLRDSEIERRLDSQKEEEALSREENPVILHNDDTHPLLSEVLKLTEKYNVTQIYTI